MRSERLQQEHIIRAEEEQITAARTKKQHKDEEEDTGKRPKKKKKKKSMYLVLARIDLSRVRVPGIALELVHGAPQPTLAPPVQRQV